MRYHIGQSEKICGPRVSLTFIILSSFVVVSLTSEALQSYENENITYFRKRRVAIQKKRNGGQNNGPGRDRNILPGFDTDGRHDPIRDGHDAVNPPIVHYSRKPSSTPSISNDMASLKEFHFYATYFIKLYHVPLDT